MSTCILINWLPYKDTCSQESQCSLWQLFLFVRVINICKRHAVLYRQFYETLNHTMFSKSLGNKGKSQVISCRCLLCQNDPQDKYLGDLFYWIASPALACSRSDTATPVVISEEFQISAFADVSLKTFHENFLLDRFSSIFYCGQILNYLFQKWKNIGGQGRFVSR